jgi:hypothetical protein
MNWRDRLDLYDLLSAFRSLGVTDPLRYGLETDFFLAMLKAHFLLTGVCCLTNFFGVRG